MPSDTKLKSESMDVVLDAIRRYTDAENPSAFLAASQGNELFTTPAADGIVVYRQAGRFAVQFGGPFAASDSYQRLLDDFRDHLRERGLSLVSVQLQNRDARIYQCNGFTVNQIGASWAVPLTDFSLRGTRFMQLRNKISRAFRNGLRVQEVDAEECRDGLRHIDRAWLATKGEDAHQLEFLVGQIGGPAQRYRRLFLGTMDDVPVSYISYSPVFGTRAGWMHDLSRRLPDRSPGLMEAINSTAIETFRSEGVGWLHFGFTPFTGLQDSLELPGHSPSFRWLMHFLWAEGSALYPAQTQLAYKKKWAADTLIPEYVAFHGPAAPPAFAHIFRACGAF